MAHTRILCKLFLLLPVWPKGARATCCATQPTKFLPALWQPKIQLARPLHILLVSVALFDSKCALSTFEPCTELELLDVAFCWSARPLRVRARFDCLAWDIFISMCNIKLLGERANLCAMMIDASVRFNFGAIKGGSGGDLLAHLRDRFPRHQTGRARADWKRRFSCWPVIADLSSRRRNQSSREQ